MSKFIPFVKLSKRAKRKISLRARKTWQISPITRLSKRKKPILEEIW